MKHIFKFILIFLLAMSSSFSKNFEPPKTKMIPVRDTLHNFIFTDFYRWLENKNDPEVLEWSKSQHNYTVQWIKGNYPIINGLHEEIQSYLDRDYQSAPFFKNGRVFFWAKKKGEQQNKLYTVINGKEKLIFDPMEFDKSGKSAPTFPALTEDASHAAIGLQSQGNEIYTYRIIDTKTGKVLSKPLENIDKWNWCKDERYAYITIRSREHIEKQLPLPTYLHKISDGNDFSKDVFLGAPKDAKDFFSIWDDDESDITFISEGDFYSNCLKIRKQGTLDQPQIIYSSKEFTAKPQVKHNKIFITTNDNAPNFKIMWTDISNPDYKNWKPFYDEKSDEIVDGCILTEQYVLVFYKKDIMRHCKVIDYSGKFVQDLNPPEFGDVAGGYYDKKTKKIYISLSTFVSQAKLYELSEDNLNNWKLIYQDKSPINTDNIESKLVFYKSKDGTNIPMFLCYRKDMALDGNNPTLLYGYGGFNISMGPSYLGTTASFINRGGVYAIACLRGGNEYGENWHRAGMLDKKQNGFDDFISAAEYLISEKYTNPQKLAIRGGSNGGLLIGAAVTQRPELFKAAVCGVPLLDMLRYHKFLIARYWIAEYGNAENEKDFKYIIRYSPYQNIKLGWNYPTMLVKAGENDARVDPLHAKKFVAALQNLPSQINPIMLYVDFESGHGSGQSTEQMIENIELEWQFIMGETGIR